MGERIVLRTGEALVAGGPPGTAAEPEIVIGELDGPVGNAFATLLGDQVKGHSRVLAILNTDYRTGCIHYNLSVANIIMADNSRAGSFDFTAI